MHRLIGRLIEWFLSYEHEVTYEDASSLHGLLVPPSIQVVDDKMVEGPYKKYLGDAGYDLFAWCDVTLEPGATTEVPSGLIFDPKDRIWFEVKSRSSTLRKLGLEVVDSVIDRDYRGEVTALIFNPSDSPKTIRGGDRLFQVVPHRLIPVRFSRGRVRPSERGTRGFGSTGR